MNSSRIPLVVILVASTLLFLYLLKPFLFPLFWAAVIAGVFNPLYKRVQTRLGRPTASAAFVLSLIIIIFLTPAAIMAVVLFEEARGLYGALNRQEGGWERGIAYLIRAAGPLAEYLRLDQGLLAERAAEMLRSVASYVVVNLKELTQNTLAMFVKFAIMLYTLFFFLRDGESFLAKVMRLCSLGEGRERLLAERFLLAARSTLKVTLIIGGIQGVLGGVIFFVAGIEGALLWGLVMIIAAVIPVVGCSIVWGPAGLIMLLTGHLWEGVFILAAGFLLISTVDNFLRPILLGRDVEMHPLLIFLSTLGGIGLFGFTGFVLGPILTSLVLAIWEMYGEVCQRGEGPT